VCFMRLSMGASNTATRQGGRNVSCLFLLPALPLYSHTVLMLYEQRRVGGVAVQQEAAVSAHQAARLLFS